MFRASFQVAWPLGPLDFRLAFDHFKQWIDLRDLDKETRVLDHQIPESIDGYIPLLVIITINSSIYICIYIFPEGTLLQIKSFLQMMVFPFN